MGRKKPTILRATPARLTTARMREDEKDDNIVNPFLLLFQGQDCLNRRRKMFSVEYKPGVSQGGSVICPISSVTMSQAFSQKGRSEAYLEEPKIDMREVLKELLWLFDRGLLALKGTHCWK
jgi:hypothetical protein